MPTKKKDKTPKPQTRKITLTIEPEPPKVDGRSLTHHGPGGKELPRGRGFAKGNKYAFKPGQSGNPLGRAVAPQDPNRRKISVAYRAKLGDLCDLPGCEGLTWAEAIAQGMVTVAAGGDVSAAKEIREVTEGKLPETHRIGNEDDKPFLTEVTAVDARIRDLLTGGSRQDAKPHGAGGKAGASGAAGKKSETP